jgi:charged multivesicular body protein 4
MKGAADALKKSHKDMDIDKVHDMMDDIAEQNDIANEISNAISTGIVSPNAVDDDELARELEELEQEGLDQELLNVGPTPTAKLPDVPSTDLPTAAKDKDKKKGRNYLRETFFVPLYKLLFQFQRNQSRKKTWTILI